MDPDRHDLWTHCFAAARNADVDGAIANLYADLDQAVADRSPRCDQSGRCCDFDGYKHRLYVTALETARFLIHVSPATMSKPHDPRRGGLPILTASKPACVYQHDKLCTVHTIRPLGCRVFFCEPGTEAWQQDTYEHFMSRLRDLHDSHRIPYAYIEWRASLDEAAEALGRGAPLAPKSDR
ncbi:MAG: YkgJ family cysteine cluster protein [Phycisphaeraceae bacterium]